MRGRGRGRGPARGAAAAPVSRAGTRTRRGDFYEAEDAADPRARRAEPSAAPDAAAGLEELPDDFDDEEIDEDAAFTDADKARWGDLDEYGGGGAGGSGSDEDEEIEWEDGEGDMLAHLDAPDDAPRGGKRGASAADVDEFLSGSEDAFSDEDDDAGGADADAGRRHAAMLHAAGVGAATRKRKLAKAVLTEAYPESEFNMNPTGGAAGDALAGGGLSVDELASGLGGGAAAGALRAKLRRLERAPNAAPLAAPLAAPARARLERGAAYAAATEHVTRWQPLVKANREAATLSFPAPRDSVPRAADSTAALVAAFAPESELERQVAALLDAGGAASAAAVREAEALALNAGTVEEAKERQARLAKMRSLLFFHEAKARRLKAIKSKGFHRHEAARLRALARKLGDTGGGGDADEAAKAEEAAELARVTERFGLKHRNTSRWARRAIAKGIAHLPGTREALQEQIRLGQTLRRKANAAPGSRADRGQGDGDDGVDASDDDFDDDDDDGEGDDAGAGAARRRAAAEARARAAALDVLAGGADAGDAPASAGKGLQALPFMVKAQAKHKAAAQAAAAALLAELDGNADGFAGAEDWGADGGDDVAAGGAARGRRTFAGAAGEEAAARLADGDDDDWEGGADGSDSEAAEARLERAEAAAARRGGAKAKTQQLQAAGVGAKAQQGRGTASTGMAAAAAANGGIAAGEPRLGGGGGAGASGMDAARASAASHSFAFEQAAAAANGGADAPASAAAAKQLGSKERRKERRRDALAGGGSAAAPAAVTIAGAGASAPAHRTAADASAAAATAAAEGAAAAAEAADPDALVGGVSARQRALIAAAFAGDDVAAEFEAAKAAEVEAELPKAEVASQLPGWGAWAGEQKEPRWLRDQRKAAEAARASAAAKRQDAGKKHVIISEKYDHKAAAFTTQTLPYPFTSRDAFEGAMRVPMGRETNTDAAFRDMTRPKVLKQPGTIIAPIKFSRAPTGGKVDKPKRR